MITGPEALGSARKIGMYFQRVATVSAVLTVGTWMGLDGVTMSRIEHPQAARQ